MSFRGLHNRLDRLEHQSPGEPSQFDGGPVELHQPWEMHRLFLEVEAGKVGPATLEPSVAEELDEYREQLIEACRDTVGEKFEAMLREEV